MYIFHRICNDFMRWCVVGSSPYDSRLCLHENSGADDTPNSQSVKGNEELSRVYQTLTLPALSREDTSSNRFVFFARFDFIVSAF